MSNEYKDWLWDTVTDIVLDHNLADKITKVRACRNYDSHIVEGLKNGEKVKFEVWFDDELCEWRIERREL